MKRNKHMIVKGQIKDRGQIKWTAMMLTEHVQLLRELKKEDRYNDKPILDDFDLETIHEEIHLAYMRQCEIELCLWQNENRKMTGRISAINPNKKTLCLLQADQGKIIPFADIIGAKTLE
ncbi:YolD-like protein [Planomicrobium soli]|uniref:YolD-like protein n=1 Tax=Planomicrobium soli TaxID=1176648 RepID=A0A2P8GK33_9BACL|nr:YolD-like family protein [Planomicrobium soli]PSL34327.1 YolD-like protein [Planomicrobium soli]